MDVERVKAVLTDGGRLRAAINLGNKALVQREGDDAEPTGVSPALARKLAERLGLPLEMVFFNGAGEKGVRKKVSGTFLPAVLTR